MVGVILPARVQNSPTDQDIETSSPLGIITFRDTTPRKSPNPAFVASTNTTDITQANDFLRSALTLAKMDTQMADITL